MFCSLFFLSLNSHADLSQAFKYVNSGKFTEATEALQDWKPTEAYQKEYKKYWENIWGTNLDNVWDQYKRLKSEKKFLRLRLDLFSRLIQASDSENKERKKFDDENIKKESKLILKQLNGTSEGEIAETSYLKWIQKNKYYDVTCASERKRWVTQPDIEFSEIQAGLEKCPLKFEDFLTRMRRLIFAAREGQAQQEIEAYLKEVKSLKDWEKAYVKAVFNSNTGDPLKALEALSKYQDELTESEYAENYFYISQRAGEIEKSEVILNKIIKHYQKINKNSHDLIFQRGFIYYQNKKYAEAYSVFNELFENGKSKRKKNKKPSDYEQIAWLRAWSLYLNNDIEQALGAFNEMRSYTSDSSRLSYWISMCYMRQDQVLTAMKLFKKSAEGLINNETYTYYNLLSWIRYRDLKRKSISDQDTKSSLMKELLQLSKGRNSVYPVPSEDISREQIKNLYGFIISETSGDEQNNITVINDENEVIFSEDNEGIKVNSESDLKQHIAWSKLLIDNGQAELAKWHLYEIENNLKLSKNAKILIQFYADNSFYYRALSLANRQFSGLHLSFDKDEFVLKSVYPEAYFDDILRFAKQRKIDPYIILSIMKAETQYKSDAISPVGAVGLMQFMPYTLDRLSDLIDEKIKTTDLFNPKKSIEYGAAYLKKLFIELENQDPLTAAAYNGGPHRVKSWLSKLGAVDYDVFIEHIPFAETRTYVKRVLTFKSVYGKIYQKKLSSDELSYLIKPQPIKINSPLSLKEEWDPFKSEIRKSN